MQTLIFTLDESSLLLYHLSQSDGFIKAFSDDPESLQRGKYVNTYVLAMLQSIVQLHCHNFSLLPNRKKNVYFIFSVLMTRLFNFRENRFFSR